jgi:hypothetical protein
MIANKNARPYVQAHKPFQGSNTHAMWHGASRRYVVYSYGIHWPLFIYDEAQGVWFENAEKYPQSTSRHHSQMHPRPEGGCLPLSHRQMIQLTGGKPISEVIISGEQP